MLCVLVVELARSSWATIFKASTTRVDHRSRCLAGQGHQDHAGNTSKGCPEGNGNSGGVNWRSHLDYGPPLAPSGTHTHPLPVYSIAP